LCVPSTDTTNCPKTVTGSKLCVCDSGTANKVLKSDKSGCQ
jgi:hypothetical protein